MPSALPAPLLVAAGCLLALTGCARPVAVSPPDPASPALAACEALAPQLPLSVLDQPARTTDPDSDLVAAWGDPAIVLRCGVPDPQALEPTSELVTVNGVDWFPEELTAGYLFTTHGRVANVEVAVPDDYAPEAGALTGLAAAVESAVPTTQR